MVTGLKFSMPKHRGCLGDGAVLNVMLVVKSACACEGSGSAAVPMDASSISCETDPESQGA